jgi:hypothetical protein
MVGRAVMLETLAMFGNSARVIVTVHAARAMHRAGDNGQCCATQRRDPRREENDGQGGRKDAAHHLCGITSARTGAAILFGMSIVCWFQRIGTSLRFVRRDP